MKPGVCPVDQRGLSFFVSFTGFSLGTGRSSFRKDFIVVSLIYIFAFEDFTLLLEIEVVEFRLKLIEAKMIERHKIWFSLRYHFIWLLIPYTRYVLRWANPCADIKPKESPFEWKVEVKLNRADRP
jgi:hypothetical protein